MTIANGPDDRLTIDDCSFGIKGNFSFLWKRNVLKWVVSCVYRDNPRRATGLSTGQFFVQKECPLEFNFVCYCLAIHKRCDCLSCFLVYSLFVHLFIVFLIGIYPSSWRAEFFFSGLRLQGAQCLDNKLELTATISTDLSLTSLKWIR